MAFWNGRMKDGSHNDWAVGVRRKSVGHVPRAILDVPSCLLHCCISARNTSTLQLRASSDKENVLFLKPPNCYFVVLAAHCLHHMRNLSNASNGS